MNTEQQFWSLVSRGYSDLEEIKPSILRYFGFDQEMFRQSLGPAAHDESNVIGVISRLAEDAIFHPRRALPILTSLTEADTSHAFPMSLESAADQIIVCGGSIIDYDRVNDLAKSEGSLRTYWAAINAGKLHPTMIPDDYEHNSKLLDLAISRGIFTSEQLAEAILRMESGWATAKYRQELKQRYERSLINFGQGEKGLNDYGCQVFIGRDRCDTGSETFCHYNSSALTGFMSLESALEYLKRDLLEGKKVLLSKDPGRIEARNGVCGRELKTLTPEQMETLRVMFERKNYHTLAAVKGIQNPFGYQQ
ncbi:MAG: hypothetical protein WCV90_00225 [Candidatus Woesearchaeota archaeon]